MNVRAAFWCCATLGCFAAHAQTYPTRAVRLVVPYVPGGGTDFTARVIAPRLGEALGQQIVVENRPGGGTNIGSDLVAKAAPDGYTLLMAGAANAINMSLYADPPYDTLRDLAAVSLSVKGANVLLVHPSLPVKTLKELLALARAQPGKLNYASSGLGSANHMAGELLKLVAGVNITHIPYKGTGPMLIDHMAGHIQVSLLNLIAALPQVETKRLRALIVTGVKRSNKLPEVPTFEESGIAGFDDISGHMILVPAGTPKDIIARLNRELVKALRAPEVVARLENEGAEIIGNTPEEAAAIVRADLDKWADVIKRSGIKPD